MEYTKSHAVLKTVVFMCRLSVSGSRLMLQNWTRIVLNITIAICMIQYITFFVDFSQFMQDIIHKDRVIGNLCLW